MSAPDIDTGTLNYAWARLITQALVDCGVTRAFISPGSRSTPLTLAAAHTEGLACTVHIDERGAAFAAQGYSRAGHGTAALICTSGTAAANYYPAVIEAAMAGVPLLVLSADRPPELRGTGANQTIDQVELYGRYPRYFHDLPCPDPGLSADLPHQIVRDAAQAARGATNGIHGPAHINCMFREPLSSPTARDDIDLAAARACFDSTTITANAEYAPPSADPADLQALIDALRQAERPLIVLGELRLDGLGLGRLATLIQRLNIPCIADATSGLAAGDLGPKAMAHHDLLLATKAGTAALEPDCVLQIGGRVTSKILGQRLGAWSAPLWRLRLPGAPEPDNAGHREQRVITALPVELLAVIGAEPLPDRPTDSERLRPAQALQAALSHWPPITDELSEMAVAAAITAEPDTRALYLSASLPVRLVDNMVAAWNRPPQGRRIIANRGASGIDGVVSSACGYSLLYQGPVTLLIGDLALLHDLNGLALARQLDRPFVIVALNNDGGGIFELLPVRRDEPDDFERYFGTPHGMDFAAAAQQFGLAYHRPETLADFRAAYHDALHGAVTLIEVKTDRRRTAEIWQQAKALAVETLDN